MKSIYRSTKSKTSNMWMARMETTCGRVRALGRGVLIGECEKTQGVHYVSLRLRVPYRTDGRVVCLSLGSVRLGYRVDPAGGHSLPVIVDRARLNAGFWIDVSSHSNNGRTVMPKSDGDSL